LEHVSCHYSSDKLYGGSLLQSSLTGLAAACPRLRSLTLLNVDVNDAVLLSIGAHCSGLQHLALGRTEDNAFGCMASDEGMRQLVGSCTALASLALFRCYAVGDVSLRTLGRFAKRLRRLVLHNCPQVGTAGSCLVAASALHGAAWGVTLPLPLHECDGSQTRRVTRPIKRTSSSSGHGCCRSPLGAWLPWQRALRS
jgi:hypothetical protein